MYKSFNFSTSSKILVILQFFFNYSHSLDVKWHLIRVCTYIPLIANYVEHFSMWLLTICMSSLEKCLFKSFAHFKIGFIAFLLLHCRDSLRILYIKPLSDICFVNIFSYSVGCLFTFLIVSFLLFSQL